MSWYGDAWDWMKEHPGTVLGGPGGAVIDWALEDKPQPTSDVPKPDAANFQLPGWLERQNKLNQLADSYGQRTGPQAQGATAQGTTAQDSALREYQTSALDRLRGLSEGQDSLAQAQLQRANNANIAQQRSLAASAGPGSAAAMARLAAQNIGRINTGAGQRAAELGIQERNAATNALGALAGQARGQDQQTNQFNANLGQQNNQFNAGQQQQNNQFNANAQMQQTSMNDRAASDARAQELQNASLQQQGTMGYEQNNTSRYGIDKGVDMGPSNAEKLGGLLTGVGGAAQGLGFASDARTKTNIRPAGAELDALIARLHPHSFEYRGGMDPLSGRRDPGARVGVMAQDVERGGPAGRALVADVGGIKALDTQRTTGTALALLGRLGERMDRLEGVTGRAQQGAAR